MQSLLINWNGNFAWIISAPISMDLTAFI
jgi:hypothetical protein